ncbi:MAG: bifunctional phosphoglucose/phosphomannose isomerase [Methanomassiliicoccales archaeon]|jgi:glucose/mannose-6-phosphate isomerase
MVEKLDDLHGYSGWDREDMLSQLVGFVNQIKESIGYSISPIPDVNSACLCGVGGSAMCGDIILDYLAQNCDRNVSVVRGMSLPRWVARDTLVVVMSYSGNTREALDIFQDSISKGLKTVCVSSGGELIKLAKQNHIPFIQVPSGTQPRAALGYLLGAVAVILDSAGICSMVEAIREAIPWAISEQPKMGPNVPTSVNAAKKIAIVLQGSVPSVYSPKSIRSVGVRWQNQINENAKMVAFAGEIPEMNHNQMVGWLGGESVFKCKPVFIIPNELESTVKKMTLITIQMFNEKGLDPIVVQLEGKNLLENILYGIMLGDMVSFYLARLRGIDPSPVDVIVEFKKRIRN